MRWWPWSRQRAEDRAGGYTDQIIAAAEAEAVAGTSSAIETAAAEVAAGITGRAFASASVEGDRFGVVNPDVLMLIGRELVRCGESAHVIEGPPLRLTPAGNWNVHGNSDPETWRYRIDDFGPDTTRTRWLPGSQVVHCRVNSHPRRPFEGRSPFEIARLTADTASAAEKGAAAESKIPSARIAPVPTPDETQRDSFASRLRKGGVVPVQAGASPVTSQGQEPANRWTPAVMRPDMTAAHVELRRSAMLDLLAAAGIPPSLADSRSEGSAQREGYRRLLHSVVQPIARIVEAELSAKLETDIRLSFRSLAAGDTAGRTRSIKQLTDAGLPLNQALEIVGLVETA